MAKIVLKHTGPLTLPNGQTLRPDAEVNVDRWDVLKNHNVVKAWLNAGLLLVDGKNAGNSSPAAKGAGGKGQSPASETDAERLAREQKERDDAKTAADKAAADAEAARLAALQGGGNGGGSGDGDDDGEGDDEELTEAEKVEAKELGVKVAWNSKPSTVRAKVAEAKAAKG